MAGFNFDSIKNGFSKLGDSFRQPAEDREYEDAYEEETSYEDEYEGGYQEGYKEEYEDDASYSENAYDEENYDDGAYEEGAYDDDAYDAPYSDDASYDDDGYYAADDEEAYDEDGYAEGGYAQDDGYSYDDGDYSESGSYSPNYDDEDDGDLGYNPAVFDNLDSEDTIYDDEYADENGVYDEDGEYYEDGYVDQDEEPSQVSAVINTALSFIFENDIVMYAALVILPPLGIYLLWKKNKFDITVRSAISVVSLIWMIILLILLFNRGGDTDVTDNPPPDFLSHTATVKPTESLSVTAPVSQNTVSTIPSATPNTSVSNPGNITGPAATTASYVYAVNTDIYYHTLENCGGMVNASRMTLDSATSRGKTACPVCIGGIAAPGANGLVTPVGTQYFATPGGKWYHTNSTCQGMTSASVVTEANAIADGKTACPECIGYYGTPGGKYYHSLSNCSKMQNAITNTEAEWVKTGKTACPECITGGNKVGSSTTDSSTMVYATQGGTYFHSKSDCSGMKNANRLPIASAVQNKKDPCPKCITPENINVFGTSGGKYYHTKNNCSGMKDAQNVTAEFAISYGKEACPVCAGMLKTSSGSGSSNSTASNSGTTTTGATGTGSALETDKNVYVYATKGGTYFHTKSNCTGMANASRVTFQQAVNAGKARCPVCVTTKSLNVFATSNGKWFHTVSDCQGMKNAVSVTAEKAISYGKTACPVCAKILASSGTTGNTTGGTTTGGTTTGGFTGGTGGTSFTPATGGTTTSGSASSTVYIKLGSGSYNLYHAGSRCNAQGVSGASAVTLEYAIGHGYNACPSCNPPSRITG